MPHTKKKETTGKTLEEVLRDIGDDEIISIGAKTAFIFVGVKSEFFRDVEEISKKHGRKYLNAFVNADKKLSTLGTAPVTIGFSVPINWVEYADRFNDDLIDQNRDDLLRYFVYNNLLTEAIMKRSNDLRSAKRALKVAIDNLEGYEPDFLKREVVEIYKKTALDYGTVITIVGTENGDYWDLEEYRRAIERQKRNNLKTKSNDS